MRGYLGALAGLVAVAAAFTGCGDDGSAGGGGGGAPRGTWRTVSSGTMSELKGVWGTAGNNVFAIGADVIRRFNGTAWVAGPELGLTAEGMNGPVPAFNLTAIGGFEAGNYFVAGTTVPEDGSGDAGLNQILRVRGAQYSALSPDTATTMTAVWGRAANEVWAVGGERVLRWGGSSWSRFSATGLAAGSDLYAVWGTSADNMYVSGARVYHLEGGSWVEVEFPGSSYYFAIWGSSASDVWVLGNGAARHWNGREWERVLTGTTEPLRAAWGSAANDVWAVGDNGTILHYNGTAWSTIASNTRVNLRAVYGLGANDVWAVGANGTTLHYTY
ncbi:MAG: hypothetical protein JNK72_23325 [Myxococcales bacterium]|nr:hypothetical protein [Myxococcales bacterium]